MRKTFLRLTIQGDLLEPYKLSREIPLKADLYKKDEIYKTKYSIPVKPQKTNRWVYSIESNSAESLNCILNKLYVDLSPYLDKLNSYSSKYNVLLDVTIYEDGNKSRFNANLTKKSIDIIDAINAKFSLTFVDF